MSRGRQSDKYPQLLTGEVQEAVANTYAEAQIPLPVPRYGGSSNRPWVFEILKVWITPLFALSQDAAVAVDVQLSTVSLGAINFDDPRVIIRHITQDALLTSGHAVYHVGKVYDFTVADRGLLVGTDNLYLGLDTVNTTVVTHAYVSILYRLITVSASEFIGIVQSQQ